MAGKKGSADGMKKRAGLLLAFLLLLGATASAAVQLGDRAEDFSIVNSDGTVSTLSLMLAQKKAVYVVFLGELVRHEPRGAAGRSGDVRSIRRGLRLHRRQRGGGGYRFDRRGAQADARPDHAADGHGRTGCVPSL